MTKETLFSLIEKAGMVPIPITREGEGEEILDHYEGDLAGYISTAKILGAKAIYVMGHLLEEEQFFYTFEDAETDEDDSDIEVDLADFLPAFAKYKKRIGEVYCYFLMAKGGAADLCFSFDQDWMADFENEMVRAEGMALLARQKRL